MAEGRDSERPSGLERERCIREVSRHVRDAVWAMQGADDMRIVLGRIGAGVRQLGVPHTYCGVNIVDMRSDPPAVLRHTADNSGRLDEMQPESAALVVSFWQSGQVHYRHDLVEDDRYGESPRFKYRVRSVVDVPFSHGTLAISSDRARAFDEHDISVLGYLAHVLEDGFRRYDDLKALEARQSLRARVWSMRSHGDLDQLVQELGRVLTDLGLAYHACRLHLIETEDGRSRVRRRDLSAAGRWIEYEARDAPYPVEQLWQAGNVAYRRDLQADDPHDERAGLEQAYRAPIRSAIDVPFSQGTLGLNSTRPAAWSDHQVEVLTDLAQILDDGFRRGQDLQSLEAKNESLQAEIDERRRTEAELATALDEKVTLLKEIHHRVKNNLQIVSSMLNLQAAGADDARVAASLAESRIRIESIALIHEQLYESQDLAHVDCGQYVERLARDVVTASSADRDRVRLEVDVEPLTVGVSQAMYCGLVVNELLSNSLKYAFPEGRRGTIRVAMGPAGEGRARLEVADDGIGLPPGVGVGESPSLGLRLVADLVSQLHGHVELQGGAGTSYAIEFPVT